MTGWRLVIGLAGALAFQLAVLVGMVVSAQIPLWTGVEVRVRTVPVDPRSVFRGNYVRLRYPFSTLPEGAFAQGDAPRVGEVVHVRLVPGGAGIHRYAGVSFEPPSQGVFLRGRIAGVRPAYRVRFGLEAFFASKEVAVALEQDLRAGGVAVLKITAAGRAALQDVVPASRSATGGSPSSD